MRYAHTSAFAEKRTGSMALPAVFLVQIVCFAGRKYNVCSGCWQVGTPQQRNYSQMQMLSLGTGALALIVRFFTVSFIRTQLFTVHYFNSTFCHCPCSSTQAVMLFGIIAWIRICWSPGSRKAKNGTYPNAKNFSTQIWRATHLFSQRA